MTAQHALTAIQAKWDVPAQPVESRAVRCTEERIGKRTAESGPTACCRFRGASDGNGGRESGGTIHRPVHCARAAGAARGRGRVGWRQVDGVDGNAAAVWRARRAGAGVRDSRGECARDPAGHGLRLWRQAHGRGGRGSGAAGEGGRQAGEAGVDAARGVYVGVLSPGRVD